MADRPLRFSSLLLKNKLFSVVRSAALPPSESPLRLASICTPPRMTLQATIFFSVFPRTFSVHMQIPFAGFFSQKFPKAVFDFTHSSKKMPE